MVIKSKAIFLIAIAFTLSASVLAYATPYDVCAHGNTTYGVLWTTGAIYPRGNCGQCHTQHFSEIGAVPSYNFALFYDDVIGIADMFCFECHLNADLGYGQVTNYPYCVNFGGRASFYESIKKQFTNADSKPAACGSRHHLGQIRTGLKSAVGQGWGFNDDPDPCVACHPPHAAQRNYPVAVVGGKLNTAIRRPSHYKSTNSQYFLWGDDDGATPPERMDEYAASVVRTYQAPYYGDTTGARYEPSGNGGPSDGSDLPNYVDFCMDCHQYTLYDPERGVNVKAINWSEDIHGVAPSNPGTYGGIQSGSLRLPYVEGGPNYVLSCLDCHEPHGTKKRLHLIRRFINGEEVLADSTSDYCDACSDWADFCGKCHEFTSEHFSWGGCNGCHMGATSASWHGSTFPFWNNNPSF